MFILVLMAIFFGLGPSTCAAFPTQCQKDSFFDHLKQIYVSCTECTVERQDKCHECCPTLKQEPADSINYGSEAHKTDAVPSVEYNSDRPQYHVVGLFFHILIIAMVIGTLSTIVCIGFKVVKERRTAECCANRGDTHCDNHDAAFVQEVLTIDDVTQHNYPSMSTELPASISVQHLPEALGRQGGNAVL